MRIAIAEDEKRCLNQLQEQLRRFGEEEQIEIQTFHFPNGAALIEQFRGSWDMILLDIDMPVMNGMETARAIRRLDPDVLIIFITNLAQYALAGYEVQAFDYMLKPVSYPSLAMKLKLALRVLEKNRERSITLDQDGELFRVPLSHLYYVEVYNHRLCYHTMERDIDVNSTRSLAELEQELRSAGFVRCHKSVLVNARYVDYIKGCALTVAGREIPISKNRRSEVLKELLSYMKGGDWRESVPAASV